MLMEQAKELLNTKPNAFYWDLTDDELMIVMNTLLKGKDFDFSDRWIMNLIFNFVHEISSVKETIGCIVGSIQ
jgi:hypothetical protein